ncbi:hypothetical protein BDV29DRAFT_46846 [Aspergillus leporis]|uniref:Uncharacterized protein n=1 Tax=Aspergillus leporis TaxID=41062 RepID=A0A5N5WMX8_9EURO|nr:hypothetical protein BDV29DRAFT_46846 [Aspergillus leporis]
MFSHFLFSLFPFSFFPFSLSLVSPPPVRTNELTVLILSCISLPVFTKLFLSCLELIPSFIQINLLIFSFFTHFLVLGSTHHSPLEPVGLTSRIFF